MRADSQSELLKHKRRFLNQYKNALPEPERVKLIREINEEMKAANCKYQLVEF